MFLLALKAKMENTNNFKVVLIFYFLFTNYSMGCQLVEGGIGLGTQVLDQATGPYNIGCWYLGPEYFECTGSMIITARKRSLRRLSF